jgi:hypothetical protein
MTPPPDEICQRLMQLHSDLGQSNGAESLDPLLKLLAEHGLSWSDFPELFHLRGGPSSAQPAKLCHTVAGIHALVGRASTRPQQLNCRNKLIKVLAERSLDWSRDLPAILAREWRDANPTAAHPTTPSTSDPAEHVSALDVEMRVISDRVVLTETECLVAALWCLSTYVYDRFPFAPQFGLVAPASGRGKTTLRKVLEATACNAWHAHRIRLRRSLASSFASSNSTGELW